MNLVHKNNWYLNGLTGTDFFNYLASIAEYTYCNCFREVKKKLHINKIAYTILNLW